MSDYITKTITTHGVAVEMHSFNGGETWHRRDCVPIKLAEPYEPATQAAEPSRRISISGSSRGMPRMKYVRRKKWGPRSLGKASEGISLRKREIAADRARARLEAAQTKNCELIYQQEDTRSPARRDPSRSAGFARMGKLLIPQHDLTTPEHTQ